MFDEAVSHGWRVTGLYRRAGKSSSKCAVFSVAWNRKEVRASIGIRWRLADQKQGTPTKKELVLLKRLEAHRLEDVIDAATQIAQTIDDRPKLLREIVEDLRANYAAWVDEAVERPALRDQNDFHHQTLDPILEEVGHVFL